MRSTLIAGCKNIRQFSILDRLAGDLAVLGASMRMGLMGYAQISSLIGGAIILLISSIAFSFLG